MKAKILPVLLTVLILFPVFSFLPGCLLTDLFFGREKVPEAPGTYEDISDKVPPDIIIYSENTVPGDHVIIEAGLFGSIPVIELETDIESELSQPFLSDNRLFLLLGVGYDNEPGEYRMVFKITEEDAGPWEITETLELKEGEFDEQRFTVPPSRTEGWTQEGLREEREKVNRARNTTEPEPLWEGPFVWPLEARISSDFGAIRIINNGPPRRHNGIDLAAPEGTPLAAANRGIIRLAEHLMASGNTVLIDHGLGLSSAYLHMHEIYVEEGSTVEKGEIIGTVGETGFASGPHLHWSVFIGHTPVSPYRFLEGEGRIFPSN